MRGWCPPFAVIGIVLTRVSVSAAVSPGVTGTVPSLTTVQGVDDATAHTAPRGENVRGGTVSAAGTSTIMPGDVTEPDNPARQMAELPPAPCGDGARDDGGSHRGTQDESRVADRHRVSGAERRRQRLRAVEALDAASDVPQPMLALPGPAFPSLDFSPDGSGPGQRLEIQGRAIYADGRSHLPDTTVHEVLTSTSVWNCAVVVAKFLEKNQHDSRTESDLRGSGTAPRSTEHSSGGLESADRHGRRGAPTGLARLTRASRVIELGAGTGVAGIAAAILMQHADDSSTTADAAAAEATGRVLLTDVGAAVAGLEHTITLNTRKEETGLPVSAGALDWTRCEADLDTLGETDPFDVVIAADVVWVAHLIRPFVRALTRVTAPGSVAVFGYQSRSTAADRELFGALRATFHVHRVHDDDLDPVFRAPGTVQIYILTRLSSSSRDDL
eukprot:m.158829 g.158829  ORF g.158829 m.158829 type:complete len:444 (+) comp23701_c0_seq1:118-1449(+)